MESVSKTILAKLLATENILIEHRKVSTAYFDPKNRVMVLPIWKEMTAELYDLLLGHEVGHALYTPADGWHHHVTDKEKKGFKTYLNVVEDIRIEKLVQSKFPGIKTSFRKGYNNLFEQDFFGIERNDWDINELPLIDRINLHYKIGRLLNVQFKDEELHFFDMLEKLETFSDVVDAATMLYEHGKQEALTWIEEHGKEHMIFSENGDIIDEDGEDSYQTSGEGYTEDDLEDPESKTDRFFREMEKTLLDASVKPYVTVHCPTPILENIIIPYKTIAKFHNSFNHLNFPNDASFANEEYVEIRTERITKSKENLYKKFLETNKKYISYLVKEFELRRNASQFARASVAKTGKLDMKKIHQYKLNDDLFKRMTIVPQGKSHGLVMFIDYSGSMSENILATIEQTIVLATFCRKVNIPFRVYAFADHRPCLETFNKENGTKYTSTEELWKDYCISGKKFSKNKNELHMDNTYFRLREYLSSEMSGTEFKEMVKYWLLVGNLMDARVHWRGVTPKNAEPLFDTDLRNTDFEFLNGTPLNDAIISAMEIIPKFKQSYKLDVVNAVFLTDGDANDIPFYINDENSTNYIDKYNGDYNLIIRDTRTMSEGKKPPGAEMTVALLQLLKDVTKSNILGFFIAPYYGRGVILNRIRKAGKYIEDFDNKYKLAKRNKFFMLNDVGYDDYYIIPGGKDLQIEEEQLKVEKDAKKTEIKNAFLKFQKGKAVNRILLNRFVSKIA